VKLVVLTALAFLLASSPALAHHGASGYDMVKMVSGKATVTGFEWQNPHGQIHFDMTDDKGNVQHWTVETPPPSLLVGKSWTRHSLHEGDEVTIYFHAAKNGALFGIIQKVVFANGNVLDAYPDRPVGQ
jgi:Family of unknown function (DUF6152)